MVLKTFKDALETIEPMKADLGRLSDVWYLININIIIGLSMPDSIEIKVTIRRVIKLSRREPKSPTRMSKNTSIFGVNGSRSSWKMDSMRMH